MSHNDDPLFVNLTDQSVIAAILRKVTRNGELIDDLISETALALNVAKQHAQGGVIEPRDVRTYARQRVRYSEDRPTHLAMADALIDYWMGGA